MTRLGVSPLNYPVGSVRGARRFKFPRAPLSSNYKDFKLTDEWLDTDSSDLYVMVEKTATSGLWVKIGGTASNTETITGDSGGAVPPTTTNNIIFDGNTNGMQITGTPATSTLTFQDLRNITEYVVDATAGATEYQTVQAAITAANTAGGGTVYIRAGTYTEDLTLSDGVDLWGAVGIADTETCKIIGKHTPPTTGTQTIRNIFLQSATHILDSNAAGSASLLLIDCAVDVTNGYTFNLLNWTGGLSAFDIGEIQSTNDGWINNTAGAAIFMVNVTIGAGSGNICIISGNSELYNVHVQCPITYQSTGTSTINGGSWFENTITTADTATVSITNSLIRTGANQAITHNSANILSLSLVSIDVSNNPAIGGTGTIDFGEINLVDNGIIAGTITKTNTTRTETGPIHIGTAATTTTNQLDIGESSVGGNITAAIRNTDNSNTASHAIVDIVSGGVNGGDPFVHLNVTGAQDYSIGIDNSDGDKLKITDNADPSTGNIILSIDPASANAITFNNVYEFPTADGNANETLITDGAGNVDWGSTAGSGEVVQYVQTSTSAAINANGVILFDDSIPQIGEGTEVLTLAIIPKSATNLLVIKFQGTGVKEGTTDGTAALFQDATANALAAIATARTGAASPFLNYKMVAGTTSSTTFKIRMGGVNASSGFRVNSQVSGGTRIYGGVSNTTLEIWEIQV